MNEGDLVLDFCMGSGTTPMACKNTNRRYIGVEKDKIQNGEREIK
jgi:site-specific DNA-methyltransferase (adenine-specific)